MATTVGPSKALATPNAANPIPPPTRSEPISRWTPKRIAAPPSRRWAAAKPKTQASSPSVESQSLLITKAPAPTMNKLLQRSSNQEETGRRSSLPLRSS
jgi:hypothetical protein